MRKIFIRKYNSLTKYFEKIIKIPNCEEKTHAYIIGVFSQHKPKYNYSQDSLTIKYINAQEEYSFTEFQQLGDWLLFTKSMFPEALNGATPEYYDALAQMSYYRCYIILKRQWMLFEELADKFPQLTRNIKDSFTSGADQIIPPFGNHLS